MNLTTLGLTSIQIFLIFGFNTPVNAEQYKRHKYTCPESQGECTEGERAAIKLVNETLTTVATFIRCYSFS